MCSVLWNISSFEVSGQSISRILAHRPALCGSQGLKEDLLQESLHVLTHYVIRPESGIQASFQLTSRVAGELNNTLLLRNATGVFRNLSSASENARKAMRISPGLVDALFFIILSAENTPDVDSKVREEGEGGGPFVVCVTVVISLMILIYLRPRVYVLCQTTLSQWSFAYMFSAF